jgi:hypothetical protein
MHAAPETIWDVWRPLVIMYATCNNLTKNCQHASGFMTFDGFFPLLLLPFWMRMSRAGLAPSDCRPVAFKVRILYNPCEKTRSSGVRLS